MPMIPRTGGRPKTGPGHRDDAMLAMIEFQGRVEKLITMRQQHYRLERDELSSMIDDLRQAQLSWRYGEIVDDQMAEAIGGQQ